MRKLGERGFASLALVAGLSGSTLHAHAADLPTKAPPPDSAPSCFASAASYFEASPAECPLTWNGITLYGAIDVGAGYSSHGANFNPNYPQGVQEVIAKFSQGGKWQWVPNGLQRSNVGVRIKEEFAPGWSFVGNVNTDFDPYSLRLA